VTGEFSNPKVELADGVVRVHCEIVNGTKDNWSKEEGWAAGYQLFEEDTGTLIVDGDRQSLQLSPAGRAGLNFDIALPPEPGDYDIYISALREQVAWFYDRGWPFLLIRTSVDESGASRLLDWRVARQSAVKRRRRLRSLGRGFTLPFESIFRHVSLIRTLVRRDVLGRYSGSFAGAFWAVLNPLMLMLTYFFVFGLVLKSRFGNDPSRSGFALYFLAGMLPWLAFSEAAGRAPMVIVEHRNFIKKLVFPVEILPVNLVVSGLVTEFFGTVLFLLALLILRGHVPLTAVYLPALVIPQILFTAGVSWFLAALGVFVRDLAQVNGFLMTVWFFVTPICYSEASLPPEASRLLRANPIYVLVRGYRAILLESKAPDWASLATLTVVSILVFLLGHAWFYKLRKSFADLI
jgi:lipopolysaccharide transport system permease protein